MISPTKERAMDSNQSFGYFLPSAIDESWVQIAEAFLKYDLVPDPRLPRRRFLHYVEDGFGGFDPIYQTDLPPEGDKLFGYRGTGGVTAYFEKHPDRRGLVIYEPGKGPRWTGTRVAGVSTWKLPGILREWEDSVLSSYEPMVFQDDTILGLDPGKTYALEEGDELPHHRSHLTAIPDDFAWWKETEWRIRHQEIGHNASFYRLCFTGNGEIGMAVPEDDYDIYLDGEPIAVDRNAKTATATIASNTDHPTLLLAVCRTDVALAGPCVELPWEAPLCQRSWYFGRHALMGYPADGPALEKEQGDGFYIHVGGTGQIVGQFPDTNSIRLQGAYGMRQVSLKTRGTGIIRINGKEVLKLDAGEPPYRIHSFDIDLSSYANQYALVEFASEGEARDSVADWFAPVVVVNS
jgi:hypothetical protein